MKSIVTNSMVTRILSVGLALVAAAAVQAQNKSVTANVPFRFYMGSTAMAQGTYKVTELQHGAAVYLRSADSSKAATTHEIAGKKQIEPARLVFHRYGESYFLAEIWTGDTSAGEAVAVSPREKELARTGAAPTLAVIRLALQ